MIKKYLSKKYINNYSDILDYSSNNKFLDVLNKLDENKYIYVTSHLIHKEEKINQIEQYIFNLDNYITFLKNKIYINHLELRYLIELTLYNKYNIVLYSDLYYYDNVEYYEKQFIKLFMEQYLLNINFLNKYTKIKKRDFDNLVYLINTNKKRTYSLFEIITNDNMSLYIPIIEHLDKTIQ